MPVSGKRSVLEVPLTALCSVAVEEAGRAAAGAVLAPERQRPACGGAGVARRKSWLSGCRLDESVLPQHDSGYTAQANRSPDDQQKETVEGETPPHRTRLADVGEYKRGAGWRRPVSVALSLSL